MLVCWSTLSITYLWSLEGTFFQHIIGIPMGTKCAPFPTDRFLYSYEAEFMHKLIKGFTDTKYFNLTYRYINDVLFTNNPNLAIKIPLICPQRTWENWNNITASSVSFLDNYLKFDTNGQHSTRLYDIRDDFKLAFINFHTLIVIYQPLLCMESIFHKTNATLELAICFQTFDNINFFWVDRCLPFFFSPLRDRIISQRGEVWAHKTCLTPSCIYLSKCQVRKVTGHVHVCYVISIFPPSTMLRLDFRIVPTESCVFLSPFYYNKTYFDDHRLKRKIHFDIYCSLYIMLSKHALFK